MKVILIRHFYTDGNKKKKYIGRTDEPLSQEAENEFRRKLSENPDFILNYPIPDVLIVSPMKRCMQTAALIYPQVQPIKEALLREYDFGEFEGYTYEELKDRREYQIWISGMGTIPCPGGESQKAFRKRCQEGVCKWIRGALEKNMQTAVFIVHGGTIMSALFALDEKGRGFYEWQVPNGCGYEGYVQKEEWAAGREIIRGLRLMI